jgi:hypothetical protein
LNFIRCDTVFKRLSESLTMLRHAKTRNNPPDTKNDPFDLCTLLVRHILTRNMYILYLIDQHHLLYQSKMVGADHYGLILYYPGQTLYRLKAPEWHNLPVKIHSFEHV